MKFSKEFLQESLWGLKDGFTVSNKIIGKRRWVTEYERVFKFEDRFYITVYDVGSTESQYQQAYEYDDDQIECPEVFPVEIKTIVYKTQKELDGEAKELDNEYEVILAASLKKARDNPKNESAFIPPLNPHNVD